MTAQGVQLLLVALVLVLVAGAFAASEAALARVSRARAGELVSEGRRGAEALARVAADPGPTLSVSTFLRVLSEAANAPATSTRPRAPSSSCTPSAVTTAPAWTGR